MSPALKAVLTQHHQPGDPAEPAELDRGGGRAAGDDDQPHSPDSERRQGSRRARGGNGLGWIDHDRRQCPVIVERNEGAGRIGEQRGHTGPAGGGPRPLH